jgi:hypothetical protein
VLEKLSPKKRIEPRRAAVVVLLRFTVLSQAGFLLMNSIGDQ